MILNRPEHSVASHDLTVARITPIFRDPAFVFPHPFQPCWKGCSLSGAHLRKRSKPPTIAGGGSTRGHCPVESLLAGRHFPRPGSRGGRRRSCHSSGAVSPNPRQARASSPRWHVPRGSSRNERHSHRIPRGSRSGSRLHRRDSFVFLLGGLLRVNDRTLADPGLDRLDLTLGKRLPLARHEVGVRFLQLELFDQTTLLGIARADDIVGPDLIEERLGI